MSSINKPKPPVYTREGAKAIKVGADLELRRAVMSCLLWEDSFYESGKSIASRIAKLVAVTEASTTHKLAIEARSKMHLRHVPLLLASVCANLKTHRAGLSDVVEEIIQRPDELAELLAMYSKNRSGSKTLNKLSKQLQKGLARAFNKFSEYQFAKYRGDDKSIKLRDVLFLVHPKPKNQAQQAIFDSIASNSLKTPDTWEVALSAGGSSADKKRIWERLLGENKLGALALLRNLRNMQEAGVPVSDIRQALGKMNPERVLPFRFISAAKYAPQLEPELEDAMYRCLKGATKLPGTTALIVDTSPSMWGAKISARSEMDRFEAVAALAILARELCEECNVYYFNETAGLVPSRRGFALRDKLAETKGSYSKGGLAVRLANREGYDRIICLTDGQWHPIEEISARYNRSGYYLGGYMCKPTDTSAGSAPLSGKPAYMLTVDSTSNGIGYGPWTTIEGWSEQVLAYVLASETGVTDK